MSNPVSAVMRVVITVPHEVPTIRRISPYTHDATCEPEVSVVAVGTIDLVGRLERPPHPLELPPPITPPQIEPKADLKFDLTPR